MTWQERSDQSGRSGAGIRRSLVGTSSTGQACSTTVETTNVAIASAIAIA
jgi:hypothetical protein